MERIEQSERSRRAILDAALHLFARCGYRGTSVRDIAERAQVSTGTVYHHFPDKEGVFRALLDEFYAHTQTTAFPFTRVLRESHDFPANLEQLGFAARDSVRQCRDYILLTHVDMIEFGGRHLERFRTAADERAQAAVDRIGGQAVQARLRPGVTVGEALDIAQRLFFQYFTNELLFGFTHPLGHDTATAVQRMSELLRSGICPDEPRAAASETLQPSEPRRPPRGYRNDQQRHGPTEDHGRDDAHQPRRNA